jgi:hypothetical protein
LYPRTKSGILWFRAFVVESAVTVPGYILSGGYSQQFLFVSFKTFNLVGRVIDWTSANFHDVWVIFVRVRGKKHPFKAFLTPFPTQSYQKCFKLIIFCGNMCLLTYFIILDTVGSLPLGGWGRVGQKT